MKQLKTEYLGLSLRNPLIVSSSGLTASLKKLQRLEAAGAGAVVLKSVFEEQIVNETAHLEVYNAYPEAADYLHFYLKEDYLEQYIGLIAEAKKNLSIPVIGSICCVSEGGWIDFARRIEEAGADALELNVFFLPADPMVAGAEIERQYLSVVRDVAEKVSVPVAAKISTHFTSPLNMIQRIRQCGAEGVVMFNRFYEPDINTDSVQVMEADIFSTSADLRGSIRWIAMASAAFPDLDIAASTGVHTGADAVKVLLAGASAFEDCSAIYHNGLGVIDRINGYLSGWMTEHRFTSISEFCGRLNYRSVAHPLAYERAQFMKYFAARGE